MSKIMIVGSCAVTSTQYAKYIFENSEFISKTSKEELLQFLQELKDTGKFKCSHIYKMTPEVLYRKYNNVNYWMNVNWKLFPDMIYADDLFDKLIEDGVGHTIATGITCAAINGVYNCLPNEYKYHGSNSDLALWLSSCKRIVSRYRVIKDNM